MSMASRPHSIPYQAAQSVLSAYKDYDGPWYKDDLPKVMEAACVMAQHTLDLVEQFETLRNFAESCCEIIERSRNPVEEIASRLDDVREIVYDQNTESRPS